LVFCPGICHVFSSKFISFHSIARTLLFLAHVSRAISTKSSNSELFSSARAFKNNDISDWVIYLLRFSSLLCTIPFVGFLSSNSHSIARLNIELTLSINRFAVVLPVLVDR
jgi:hypothetical protein